MLNIKNEETYKLAKDLARITGKSMTYVVTEALREKLEMENSKFTKRRNKVGKELLNIAKRLNKLD